MTSYIARPIEPNGVGILMLHAWWGLNDFFRQFCDRIAEQGYTVVAPDMFGGKIATTIPDAQALARGHDGSAAEQEIFDAIALLQSQESVTAPSPGVIGISFGAYYALWLSNEPQFPITATVVLYGTGPDDFSQSQSAYQGHFAGNDDFEPAEAVDGLEKALQAAGREAEIYVYPGLGHWYFEDDRTDAYNEEAATLTFDRIVAFLQSHLL